jgi:uncharacterized protein (TIGR02145 family)
MKTQVLFLFLLFAGFASINAQTTMNIYQSNGTVLQIPISSIDSITYTVNNPGNLATITTLPIGNTSITSATCGGSISATGGSLVTQRGVCWSTSQNPTTANSSTNDGSGSGSFTSNLTGLTANTTYYVRAYAINSAGTAYGNQQSFTTTNSGSGIVSNPGAGVTYNGYTYSSVVLGNGQEWMSENLRTANYRNGDPIPTGLDQATWIATSVGAYAIYNNDLANNDIYGKLYNGNAVTDPRNVCPIGWHVPTDGEWSTLTDYLGGDNVAGGKMKTTTGWNDYEGQSGNGTNESGFSGLPGGTRGGGGFSPSGFAFLGFHGFWWCTSDISSYGVSWRIIYNFSTSTSPLPDYGASQSGFSVRCLRD